MANHKSALKRIRSNEKKRVLNRYQHKTTRNAIKALRLATDKSDDFVLKFCRAIIKCFEFF